MSQFYGDLTVAGATDCMTRFELRDSANDPITDAVAADLTATYQIDPDDTPVSISLSDLASIGAAHADGGVIHIAAGVYRLDLPDAVLAAGVAGKRPLISIVHADATINYLEPVVAFTPTTNQAAIGSLNDLSQLAVESAAQVGATAALNNYDPPTKAEIDAAIATLATAAALGVVDNVVDAIKAKTDNLPASPAATSDIPTAAQNRAEIDSNSTRLAEIVEDTGTTLPAAIAAIDAGGGGDATEANQLTLLERLTSARAAKLDLITAGGVTVSSPVSTDGTTTTWQAGDTWAWSLTGLGDLTDRADVVFAIFAAGADEDADALLLLGEVAGLERLAGAAAADASQASLTVTNEDTGAIALVVADEATLQVLASRNHTWAVKLLKEDGTSSTLVKGRGIVLPAVIRETAG